MVRVRRLAPLALVVVLVACGSDEESEPSSPATEDAPETSAAETTESVAEETTPPTDSAPDVSTLPTDVSAPPTPPADGIEVLDAGAEPRQEMRFVFEEGDTSEFAMTMTIGLEMESQGTSLPVPELPPLLIGGTIVIDSVEGDVATYTFTFDELGVVPDGLDPDEVETYEEVFAELEGVSGTAEMNSRGETLSSEIDTSGVDDPALVSQLEQFSSQIEGLAVPFPEEAVGAGAEWVATKQATLNGMTTTATTTYRLVEVDGEGYSIELSQVQEGRPGEIDLPTLPAGADAELVSSTADSTGRMVGRFDAIVPSGSMSTTGAIVMTLTMGGDTQTVDQTLDIQIEIEST